MHNVLLGIAGSPAGPSISINIDNVDILDREKNWKKRNISEMCFIKMNETINMRSETLNLRCIYIIWF